MNYKSSKQPYLTIGTFIAQKHMKNIVDIFYLLINSTKSYININRKESRNKRNIYITTFLCDTECANKIKLLLLPLKF